MSAGIEAIYIYNRHNTPILQHVYRARPPSADDLILQYLAHPAPRPPILYLPNASPPTTVHSLLHSQLLFLSPTSVDIEPLLVLEFLHRIVDVLEEFFGAPLLETKIENGYDIVAQLLAEMCDAGAVSNTEPNALRDLVDVPGWVGKLLSGVGLPGSSNLAPPGSSLALPNPSSSGQPVPQLPWRRANVRHTSNELYVDMIESLSVVLAPSGRPLSAFANGTIAFTSKISGVPDLLLTLSSSGGGKSNLDRILELPVFHPCVRLARWREKPGELSFVPPDGRFVLAGYEVDLLPFTSGKSGSTLANLQLPVSIEVRTGLGPSGADFEVRLLLSNNFPGAPASSSSSGSSTPRPMGVRAGSGLGARLGASSPAFGPSSNAPTLEDVVVSIPIPPGVRNVTDLRASRGEAHFTATDSLVEWRLPSKETANLSRGASAVLRCTVMGHVIEGTGEVEDDTSGPVSTTHNGSMTSATTATYSYDEGLENAYQQSSTPPANISSTPSQEQQSQSSRQQKSNSSLMPSSASVSFSVKGWLASGIKVDSLTLQPRTSRGIGEGVRPYKGVKYLTVSRGGVEIRC